MNLDDPTPAPVAPPEPAAPVAPVDPAPADPDEAQAIEVQGGKMVPLAALKAAREESRSLKETASKTAALEQEVAALRPYKQFLDANPLLVQQAAPRATAAEPDADPELVELAGAMDYYKAGPNGVMVPDLDRARKYKTILTRHATQIAQTMVQPVAESHAQQMSNANWSQVLQEKTPNGQPIDPQILADFWRHLPVDQTAKPQVAAMVRDLAITAQMRKSPLPPPPAAPNQPPIHTESVGRLPQAATRMTSTERRIASDRGITEEKYAKLTNDFVPGRMNPLED
jgi:hypothetical protein